mmetsp:Transcript_4833/g.9032  ORF Transcript_4833/g.9032 Transcript_4833/m.9032 type:complete len:411 (-) Transcript_4833:1392-2624(-)
MKRATRRRSAGRRVATHSSLNSSDGSLRRKFKEKTVACENIATPDESFEVKSSKRQLKETQARLTAANKENSRLMHMLTDLEGISRKHQGEAARLKEEVEDLNFQLKEANYQNSKLQKDVSAAQNSGLDQQRQAQKQLAGLKEALEDLENVMQSKTLTAKRNIGKCSRLAGAVTSAVNSLTVQPTVKNVMLKHLKELGNCLEAAINAFGCDVATSLQDDDFRKSLSKDTELENARLKDELTELKAQGDLISQYRAAFDRMRGQTKQLRERLHELESDGNSNSKKIIAELESKIVRLESEKQFSSEHVKTLQLTLSEQTTVIEHMRGLIASLSAFKPQTPSQVDQTEMRSPHKSTLQMPFKSLSPQFEDLDSRIEQVYMGTKDELTLQEEINDLDIEIQQLQSSLQRALGQ